MPTPTSPTSPEPPSADSERHYLTTMQAARYLQVSDRTLRGWNSRGIGPAQFRIGGVIRYRREDIDAWARRGA